MNPTTVLASLQVLVTGWSLLQVPGSLAVPAFARREGAKCQMCHFRLPELNEDGHSYLRRGFREERGGMEGESGIEKGAKEKRTEMGAREMAKPPVASTSRPLGELLPLEWQNYLTLMGHHTLEARKHAQTAIHPGMIDGWIGGPLDQNWSGVANLAFDIEAGSVAVEQAYAQFNTSWSPRFASVRFGQLLPLASLFNGAAAAMPLSAPVVMEVPSREQNPWAPATLVRGIEVGVVNLPSWSAYLGAGRPEIDNPGGSSHTDLYASAEYLRGKKGNAINGFGYKGKIDASPGQPKIDYERVALFGNAYGPRIKGVLGVLWGTDGPAGEKSLSTKGGFVLLEALLPERWAGYARYDYANREAPVGDAQNTDGPTIGVSYWAQTQVRLTLESQFQKSTGESRDRGEIAELMWAF